MKVLFVGPVVPWPPDSGGRLRTFHLLRELGRTQELHLRCVRMARITVTRIVSAKR